MVVNLPDRKPLSACPELSEGWVSVVQMLQEKPLGRASMKWLQTSSILIMALP